MPIMSDYKNKCEDFLLNDYISKNTQGKDTFSLTNELNNVINTQNLNKSNSHILADVNESRILLNDSCLVKKRSAGFVETTSSFSTFKKIVGLIASVTGVVFFCQVGRSIYNKNNQTCLLHENSIDVLNGTLLDEIHHLLTDTNGTLPSRLHHINAKLYNNKLCDGLNLSQHEYLKEIVVIDSLSFPDIDRLYQIVFPTAHKRLPRSITSSSSHQVNASEVINNIINNNVDWRIREEFRIIYHKAINSPEIKQKSESVEKNAKLVLACIGLMLQYLHENRVNNLSELSFIYGVAFIESLFPILDEMNASALGIIDKRYKQTISLLIRDIYSNKEGELYTNFLYVSEIANGVDEKLLENNDDYFYASIRNAVLEKKESTTVSSELLKDDVKIINLISCQTQRENLTLVNILRTISESIKSPLLSLIKETRVVYKYSIDDNGCPSPVPIEMSNAIEMVTACLDDLMSWIPYYNRGRLVSLIAASVISMIADAIENKELSLDSVSEINGNIINLTKDIVSSLSTKQIKDMDSSTANNEIIEMLKNIKYKNNKLTIHTENPSKTISIDDGYNNFIDDESKKALYYDSRNYWYVSRDESYSRESRVFFEKTNDGKLTESDVFVIKNSSPELYSDGTFIRRDGKSQVLVEGQFYYLSEMHVKDDIYRYVAQHDKVYTPLINIGGAWFFESKNSPYVSYELINFIGDNEKIKSKLISKYIIHADVTPIRFAKKTQADGKNNQYIKINDDYYLLHDYDIHRAKYIEGEYDILPVEFIDNKYRCGNDVFGNVYNGYKKEVKVFLDGNEDKKYYLDSSIIKRISENNLLEEATDLVSKDELSHKHVLKSTETHRAVSDDTEGFILFDNKYIKIISNNDDTFLLGDKSKVRAYKNSKADTYYSIPDENNNDFRAQNIKLRSDGCITKRQLFSLCSAGFYESKDITTLLSRNAEHGIHFDNPSEHLEPYEDANGFYRVKKSAEEIYFLSQAGTYFHVREMKNDGDMIPVFFKIYGKNEDNSINNSVLVSEMSLIKDFDTKKLIISTPLEAMSMVFHLDTEKSKSFLRWNKNHVLRKPISLDYGFLDDIQKQINKNNELDLVKSLFSLNGKKVITSKQHSDHYIEMHKNNYLNDPDDYIFKSMTSFDKESRNPFLMSVFNDAFNDVKININKAYSFIKTKNAFTNDYVTSSLRISCSGARDLFVDTLMMKVQRMGVVFDENDKSNIILVMNEKKQSSSYNQNARGKDNIVGFSYIHDPLDRIYIKTDSLSFNTPSTWSGWEKSRYIEKKIKNLSNIMCHEAVHALGTPEDYFYHNSIDEGEYDSIENTLIRTEIALRRGRGVNDAFINMCSLYFMSNPVYQNFELNSLLKPEALSLLFQYDDYLRALILVNNPDTITLIINDLATLS